MIKPGSAVPSKIRESTRFYPYFKDCIGAIDGTHIPAMVKGREVSSYRNRHGIQSQNVLAACDFDLQFIYVLSGWEGSAHDSKLLNDALLRRNGLEVPQENDSPSSSYLDMEDENLELLSQSQQRQRAEANAWRLTIAEAMWEDRPRNDDNESQENNNDTQDNENENNEEHMDDGEQEGYDDNEVGMDEYAAF
ncbi:uncharacterized protein LOC133729658 [Rosa rugosa]|uniref:uncharacterized protein LOC133729658 n=1 Tax=Rosa rugosa TaxID=74645 RepID=UPI002B40FAB7|nr:uncharacterized protein LOC133729658 [Rosa rugosa]